MRMTSTQREKILAAHEYRYAERLDTVFARDASLNAMQDSGAIDHECRATRSGLERAGVDLGRLHAEARVEHLIRFRHTELPRHGDEAFAGAVRRMCSAFDLDPAPFLALLESDPMYNTPMGASTVLVTGERPQQRFEPATGWGGRELWLHGCGSVANPPRGFDPAARVRQDGRCSDACPVPGDDSWQRLYILVSA